jgi:hypothetical protein
MVHNAVAALQATQAFDPRHAPAQGPGGRAPTQGPELAPRPHQRARLETGVAQVCRWAVPQPAGVGTSIKAAASGVVARDTPRLC